MLMQPSIEECCVSQVRRPSSPVGASQAVTGGRRSPVGLWEVQPPCGGIILRFTCRAILSDMDGTIVDSTAVVERQWRRWAARHELSADASLAVAHGRRTIETMREVAPHLCTSETEAACFDEEEAPDSEGVIAIAVAACLLSSLRPDSWAVVTSATLHLAHNRLRFAGLPIPSVLVSADDVRRGKPDPEGHLLAAARLGRHLTDGLVMEDTP